MEAENPVIVGTELDPALPNIIGADQFLEIGRGKDIQFLRDHQNPKNLLGNFSGERVQEILDRRLPVVGLIEPDDLANMGRLTHMLTVVKGYSESAGKKWTDEPHLSHIGRNYKEGGPAEFRIPFEYCDGAEGGI